MSLQIWLPLNGSVINNGVSQFIPSASGITYSNSGKIAAQSYASGSLMMSAAQTAKILNNNELTVAFWIKPLNDSNSTIFGNGSGGGGRQYCLFQYSDKGAGYHGIALHWSWTFSLNSGANYDASGTRLADSSDSVINGAFTINKWTHVCVTYKNPTMKVYLDGKLRAVRTGVANYSSFSYDTYLINSSSNRNINDFRLYDHCLSPREVKLLAHGLVAHYKLDAPRVTDYAKGVGYNIYTNYSTSDIAHSLTATGEVYMGYPVYRLTMTPKTTNGLNGIKSELHSHGIYQANGWSFGANTKYCYWVYYKPITHSDIRVGGTASNIGGWTELAPEGVGNGWYRVGQYRDGTVTTAHSDPIYTSFYTPSATVNTPISIDFCGAHLIMGTTTPIENYGISNTSGIEYDCSGYQNHGTYSGTFSSDPTSPRYANAAIFNGSDSSIILPIKSLMQTVLSDKCTINFWVKEHNLSSRSVYFGGFSGSNFNIEMQGGQFRVYWNGSPDIFTSSVEKDIWTMWTVVIDTTVTNNGILIYKNGTKVYSYAHTSALSNITSGFTNNNFYLGRDSRTGDTMAECAMSDFRIYASTLSADDIQQVYKSSISFIENGNLQCSDILEKPTVLKLKQNGLVQAGSIDESIIPTDLQITTLSDGSVWGRVFYHKNNSGSTLFTSVSEALHTTSTDKFSRLGDLPYYKGNHDKYEFLLTYPSLTDGTSLAGKYNRWKQTNAPQDEWLGNGDGSAKVAGYEAIHIDWDGQYWGGLARQNASTTTITDCYIDGSTNHSNWFYAIGANTKWQNGIPGPHASIGVTATELWVRLDTNIKFFNQAISTQHIYEL